MPPSLPRIYPRKRARRKPVEPDGSECARCKLSPYCRGEVLHRQKETAAMLEDRPKPECGDREPDYLELMEKGA